MNLPDPRGLELLDIPVLDKHTRLIYHPLAGILYQKRFQMVVACLGEKKNKILEIGFGRGILLGELSAHCDQLYGIDIHHRIDVVNNMLQKERVGNIVLGAGSATAIPYKDGVFDAIVCVSVLEHLTDLKLCFVECSRVLKDSGELIIGFPVRNWLTDLLFRLLHYDARKIHPSSHRDIENAAGGWFILEKNMVYPGFLPVDYSLYCVGKFTKRK
jgi:ubiquinone/menaquinone biosynthesis C-methylase UbiE